MIIEYETCYKNRVGELLKESQMRMVWGEKALGTFLAVEGEEVVGIAGLYSNQLHPNRSYINVYISPYYRREGLGKKLVNELKQASRKNDFQASVLSQDEASVDFLKGLGFKRARKSFTPVINKRIEEINGCDSMTVKTVEEAGAKHRKELTQLHLTNYILWHEEINPLNKAVSISEWQSLIFNELDETNSRLLIENERVKAYLLCYETGDAKKVEVGYVGGETTDQIPSYLSFYISVLDELIDTYEIIEIEADDVDPFAFAVLSFYEYDETDSLDTYIFNS